MNPAELFRHETEALPLSPGQILFREGEPGTEMYVLLEGEMGIVVNGEVVETAQAGALLGEMAMIEPSPRTATVVARSSCRLAAINQRRFHFLVSQTPHFATHVMKVLATRLRHMNERMAKAVPNYAPEARPPAGP